MLNLLNICKRLAKNLISKKNVIKLLKTILLQTGQ